MSVSIMEALLNAEHNFQLGTVFTNTLAGEQLHNAVTLLKKGYSLDEQVEPLLEKWGGLEGVPDKEVQHEG